MEMRLEVEVTILLRFSMYRGMAISDRVYSIGEINDANIGCATKSQWLATSHAITAACGACNVRPILRGFRCLAIKRRNVSPIFRWKDTA